MVTERKQWWLYHTKQTLEFKTETGEKEGHYVKIKELILQEDVTVIIIYEPNVVST